MFVFFFGMTPLGIEQMGRVIYSEMKELLKARLFRAGWEDSVRVVQAVQTTLRAYVQYAAEHFSADLTAALETKMKVVVFACESVASIYLELLLTSGGLLTMGEIEYIFILSFRWPTTT